MSNQLLTAAEFGKMMADEFDKITAGLTPNEKARVAWEIGGWMGGFPPEPFPGDCDPQAAKDGG